jgi:glucan 1,3-beta-glucosidase
VQTEKFIGVNLGGWLVLERWITPKVFSGTVALDEYTLCQSLGVGAQVKLDGFRDSFITEKDFKWIAAHGLNAVRLPVGYWAFIGARPYASTAKYIEEAFEWAEKFDLKIILSLHGAPGSQNGKDHSGKVGYIDWYKGDNVELTYKVLKIIIKKYGQSKALAGIELLNEPDWRVPRRGLAAYYNQAYRLIREGLDADVVVIINDHYKPGFWKKFSAAQGYENIILDRHIYKAYTRFDRHRSLAKQLKRIEKLQPKLQKTNAQMPLVIGEWSLALPEGSQALQDNPNEALKAYADAQLKAFSGLCGWFYWTYKTEDAGPWNFRTMVEKGLITLPS